MPHPLCSPPPRLPPSPRGGAGAGPAPERSGGPRRLPSLQYSSTPSLSPPPRCALQRVKRCNVTARYGIIQASNWGWTCAREARAASLGKRGAGRFPRLPWFRSPHPGFRGLCPPHPGFRGLGPFSPLLLPLISCSTPSPPPPMCTPPPPASQDPPAS
jgi:hypothetical protein